MIITLLLTIVFGINAYCKKKKEVFILKFKLAKALEKLDEDNKRDMQLNLTESNGASSQ